jgi:death on curing protein
VSLRLTCTFSKPNLVIKALLILPSCKVQGALGRIDNSIAYEGLNDIFEIAAKYATAIAVSHAFPDANKRTALAVCLEYLSLNEFELTSDNECLADAVRDLVIGAIDENDFADLLYGQYIQDQLKPQRPTS